MATAMFAETLENSQYLTFLTLDAKVLHWSPSAKIYGKEIYNVHEIWTQFINI
jgi:hypothetical protein